MPNEAFPARARPIWAALTLLCACGPAADIAEDAQPGTREADGTTEALIWTADCLGPGVECAVVQVPYDHANPEGGTFPMQIARAKHRFNVHYRGAILMNFGGPGVDGTPYVGMYAEYLDALRNDYDIVSYDPRGGGYAPNSEPLGCLTDGALFDAVFDAYDGSTDPAHLDKLIAAQKAWFDDCRETNPKLVDHMGMNAWADDLDTIREALGLDKISYYGGSGGTSIGLTFADRHPDRVDRFVLDSTLPAYGGMYTNYQVQLDGYPTLVNQWVDSCAADPSCAVHDDPLGALNAVFSQATDAPLDVDGRRLTWGRAALGIAAYFYNEGSWPYIGTMLAAAQAGDGAELLGASDGYLTRFEDGSYAPSNAIYFHTECADNTVEPTSSDIQGWVAADVADLGNPLAALGALDMTWCAAFPEPIDPVPRAATAEGAPPMLMLQSREDAATPLPGALGAQASLVNGTVMVIQEGKSHGVLLQSDCIFDKAISFYRDGTLPVDGTVCE